MKILIEKQLLPPISFYWCAARAALSPVALPGTSITPELPLTVCGDGSDVCPVIRIAGVVTDSPFPLQRVLMFRHGLEPSCRSYPLVGLCPEDTPAAFFPYMNTFIFELIVHRMLSVTI